MLFDEYSVSKWTPEAMDPLNTPPAKTSTVAPLLKYTPLTVAPEDTTTVAPDITMPLDMAAPLSNSTKPPE